MRLVEQELKWLRISDARARLHDCLKSGMSFENEMAMETQGRSPYILIADDNEDLAASLSCLVKIAGYESEVAHDGEAALKKARQHAPDIVLLDIGLPGLDGFQVAEQMRGDERLKSVRIIAISGYPPEMFKGRVGKLGFDYHLVKPVDFNDLLLLLRVPE